MLSVLQVARKAQNQISFSWDPEPGHNPSSYKIYCSFIPTSISMQLLAENIAASPNRAMVTGLGKVIYNASVNEIQALLGPTVDLVNGPLLYFTLTYVENSVESAIASSAIIEVPPVGIGPKIMKDDPTANRHPYVFSENLQRWHRQSGSSRGALITDAPVYYRTNEIQDLTYDSSGNVLTIKAYLEDATSAGCYAKLVSYTYNGSNKVTRMVVTDTTV